MNNLLGGNAAATLNDLGTIAVRQNAVLGSIGPSDPSAFSMAKIVARIIFGAVGFSAFVYGKKERSFKPLCCGHRADGLSLFVNGTLWLRGRGAGSCPGCCISGGISIRGKKAFVRFDEEIFVFYTAVFDRMRVGDRGREQNCPRALSDSCLR